MSSWMLILYLTLITYIHDTYFCEKIKKIKHITINIVITWGIVHCTILTIDVPWGLCEVGT